MVSLHHAFVTTQAASLFNTGAATSSSRKMPLHESAAAAAAVAAAVESPSSLPSKQKQTLPLSPDPKEHDLHTHKPGSSLNDRDNPSMTGHSTKAATVSTAPPLHFCFIVHGHQGRPTDLSYLHHTVKAKARENKEAFAYAKSSDSCVVGSKSVNAGEHSSDTDGQSNNARTERRRKRDRFFPRKKRIESNVHDNQIIGSTLIDDDTHDGTQAKGTLIVHNAACNEGKTHDGIIKGGERLADEMLEVIRSEVKPRQRELHQQQQQQQPNPQEEANIQQQTFVDVTISIVGNSLGGLYGRYAIAHLAELLDDPAQQQTSSDEATTTTTNESFYYLLDNHIRIHPNVFYTTASPHLGCASHTYLPLPRTAELGVAQVLGTTGHDLFRINTLVRAMATEQRYLEPLGKFRSRVAYANVYGTDFPVPGSTAAFLDGGSDYPHYFEEEYYDVVEGAGECGDEGDIVGGEETGCYYAKRRQEQRVCPASVRGLIAATLHTPRLSLEEKQSTQTKADGDDLTSMSSSLDSLGWKKVFVDIRNEIPMSVSLPTLSLSRSGNTNKGECPIRQLKANNQPVSSADLEKAISSSNSYRLSLPLGHNAICAFSRGSVSTAVNSGGRPVMDSLAMDLTDQISMWRHEFN